MEIVEDLGDDRSEQEEPSEKVVNFSGNRKEPTHLDYQELAKYLMRYVEMAKAGEIHSFGIVCGHPDGPPITEGTVLPGASDVEIIGGLNVLAAEMSIARVIRQTIENAKEGDELGE